MKDQRGGKRTGAGRKKVERISNPNVSASVLHDVRSELLEKACIALEVKRLGIDLDRRDFGVKEAAENKYTSVLPLMKIIDRLKCHAFGNPRDTVNHQHDKPLEVNATVSIRSTLEKAFERATKR